MGRKIFCFSGIDGSGKSTHIALLTARLRASNRKFRYIWFRYPKFFSFLILGLCRVLGLTAVIQSATGMKIWKTRFYLNAAVGKLWPYFQLIDTILYWVNKVYVPCLLGCVIILDRSPVDTLVDVAYDVRKEKLIWRNTGRLFRYIIPSQSLNIIFDTNEEIAIHRKDDVYDTKQLTTKRRLYGKLAEAYGWHVVDTTRPVSEVHSEVMHSARVYLSR